MIELNKNEKIKEALLAAQELIKIDINYLKKIENISNYRKDISNAIFHLFSFLDIIDPIKIIDNLYDIETNKLKMEKLFFDKYFDDKIDKKNEMLFAAEALSKLYSFANYRIYYICFHYTNKKYPLFSLCDYFHEITEKVKEELDIPMMKIIRITEKYEKEKHTFLCNLKQIELMSGFKWFEKSKEYNSDIISRSNVFDEINSKCENNFEECEFKTNKKSNSYNLNFLESTLMENCLYDQDSKTFNSLNIIGFRMLRKYNLIEKNKEKNISKILSNEQIMKILNNYKELGLSGVFLETCKSKKSDSNVYFSGLCIKLSKKAKWNKCENDLFEKYLKKINYDLNNLKYDENETPILIL